MGCPSEVTLGNSLVFSICCHDPDTGILTDADSAPTYRIYANETTTPVATGTMAKLDDSNTTGFYTELINVTAANGYVSSKNYTIYVTAIIDGNEGGVSFAFTTY